MKQIVLVIILCLVFNGAGTFNSNADARGTNSASAQEALSIPIHTVAVIPSWGIKNTFSPIVSMGARYPQGNTFGGGFRYTFELYSRCFFDGKMKRTLAFSEDVQVTRNGKDWGVEVNASFPLYEGRYLSIEPLVHFSVPLLESESPSHHAATGIGAWFKVHNSPIWLQAVVGIGGQTNPQTKRVEEVTYNKFAVA